MDIVGYAAGAAVGSVALKLWGDMGKSVEPEERHEYGNWWLGCLAFGTLGALLILPMAMFARSVPSELKVN